MLNTAYKYANDIRMVCVIILTGQTSSYCQTLAVTHCRVLSDS